MPDSPKSATTQAFEDLLQKREGSHYSLRLYITGMTPRSTDAVAAIKAICEEFLPGRYDLEVIDIYQHPEEARSAQVIASPTLLKRLPDPLRRLIGDLSNRERVLIGLDLVKA
ncbi:MAG TPA: circadian clock KaiB family protein [Gemmatimonadales bacterium]|nr:circadian clock KaiB family protein [Gemmatimonadales bacterium]